MEAIEQTLIESKEFHRYDIDQVELFNEIIILKPGKQTRGDKTKLSAIYIVVLEDKTKQARKALKLFIQVDLTITIQKGSNGER